MLHPQLTNDDDDDDDNDDDEVCNRNKTKHVVFSAPLSVKFVTHLSRDINGWAPRVVSLTHSSLSLDMHAVFARPISSVTRFSTRC